MKKLLGTVAAVAMTTAGSVGAQDVDLPSQLSWSAYGLGSTGYNQSVAIGSAMKSAYGTNLRILPGKNDISRAEPLRQGKVDFSAAGVGGVYFGQEGVFDFSDQNWGPQKTRVLLQNAGAKSGFTLVTTKASCEKAGKPDCEGFTMADLAGLRVASVKGSPAITVGTEAFLAYGGLTWDDVEVVEFGGYGDTWKALSSGNVDATYASTTVGTAYEVEAGPLGIFWPAIDPENAEGVARMQDVGPYLAPHLPTDGAGIDAETGTYLATYPYPVLVAMEDQDPELVYQQTRAIAEQYDAFKGSAPGADGWSLEAQNLTWLVPFHEGAVRYFDEAGLWSEEAQAHNDQLIARQEALVAAWDELKAEDPENWDEAWAQKRRDALEAGGFKVVF